MVVRRSLVFLLSVGMVVSVEAQQARRRPGNPPPPPPPPVPVAGQPLAGLTAAQLAAFNDGVEDFNEAEEPDEGLGPVFNERSCAACHTTPTVGGGSNRTVTRFGTRAGGTFDALANLGGSLMQDHALTLADAGVTHAYAPEVVPAVATIVAHRRTTALFGLGLVDATPDSDFLALAQLQSARRDGTAGRVHMVDNISAGTKSVGKFGWKSQNPTLFQFAGDAYVNEMGITNPQFPSENCPQGNCAELAYNPMPAINDTGDGVQKLADFMSFLAPPPRGAESGDTEPGEQTFDRIGCTACHVATMQTGSNRVAALDHKTYHPYSDFLLHDMGALGDGIEQGDAKGRDMRTAPLWGLRFAMTLLHDGRANSIEAAVLAHDGQARPARDRFAALDKNAKDKLMAFLGSL